MPCRHNEIEERNVQQMRATFTHPNVYIKRWQMLLGILFHFDVRQVNI